MKYYKFYIRIEGISVDEIEYYVFTNTYEKARKKAKEYVKTLQTNKFIKVKLFNA